MFFVFILISLAFAQECVLPTDQTTYECGTGLTCTFKSSAEFEVSGTGAMTNFTEAEPAPWRNCASKIASITISPSITHIGDRAFDGITSLTALSIPDSVEYIGTFGFGQSIKVKDLTIGETSKLKIIGQNAFQALGATLQNAEYDSLEYTFPASVQDILSNAFASTGARKLTFKGVKTIASRAFSDANSLKVVNIANTVDSIADDAFFGLSSLEQINILDNGNAKYTSLEGVLMSVQGNDKVLIKFPPKSTLTKIPEGTTIIGQEALMDMEFTQMELPTTLKVIRKQAFQNTKLTSITFNEGLETLEEYAFRNCQKLKTVTVSKSLKSIASGVFDGCIALENFEGSETEGEFTAISGILYTQQNSVLVKCPTNHPFTDGKYENPSSLKIIYNGAFKGVTKLKTLVLKHNLETIHPDAFSQCPALTTVTIEPTFLDSISSGVFFGCKELTKVTFGNGVKMIGDTMFSGCTKLSDISIGDKIYTIESDAFKETAIKKIVIPDTCVYIKYSAFQFCESLEEVTIGSNSIEISENAFYGCKSLKTLTFKDQSKLVRIDSGAFNGIKIDKVTIPPSVLIVDDDSFADCPNLKEITYQGKNQPSYCSPTAFEDSPVTKVNLRDDYPQQEFCGIRIEKPSGGNNGTIPDGGNNGTTPDGGNNGTTPDGGNKPNGTTFITVMMMVISLFLIF